LASPGFCDPPIPTLYLAVCEGAQPERVLLFEESLVHDHRPETAPTPTAPPRRIWHRMKEHYDDISLEMFASDRFVRKAEKFGKVKVLLNSPLESTEVREWIDRIIRENSFHHLRWLIIDGILLPVSLLAAFLPGPNVVGYYLLLRVISHWRSYRAASLARIGELEVQLSPRAEEVSSVLSGSSSMPAALQQIRSNFGLRAVQEHKLIPQGNLIKAAWKKLRQQLR
jgi:Mitochondrial K+-H+ exchange-related